MIAENTISNELDGDIVHNKAVSIRTKHKKTSHISARVIYPGSVGHVPFKPLPPVNSGLFTGDPKKRPPLESLGMSPADSITKMDKYVILKEIKNIGEKDVYRVCAYIDQDLTWWVSRFKKQFS